MLLSIGNPVSEMQLRGNTNIKILNDEEIKGMRLACKVNFIQSLSLYIYKYIHYMNYTPSL